MNYALIGCGRIAKNHIKAARENGLHIVAVCDVCPEAMERVLASAGLEKDGSIARYTDYRRMLAEKQLTLCSIATESGLHAEITLYCIEHGIHVIVEKPMAMSMADADEIVKRSSDRGVKVCACHQNRFNHAVQRARQALEKGRFGRLSHGTVHVRWSRDPDYYAQAPWRGTWAQDGGCLMNQCIHGIDLLRWMMGDEIEEIFGMTAQRHHGYLQAEDVGVAVVKFKNGALGTVEGTTNVYPANLEETLYLFGETGTVKLGGKSVNRIDVWEFADRDAADGQSRGLQEESENVYGNGHTALFADMIEAIERDRAPLVDATAGRNALETVLAIYKSRQTGAPVRLPLRDFSATDMSGTFD